MRRFLFISIIVVISTSCSKTIFINLSNKEFIKGEYKEEYPYTVEKLNFINNSICIYTQEFLCDIDSAYKITQTICSYSVKDNYIILENARKDSSYNNLFLNCIPLPDSIIQQCKYMRDDLLDIQSRLTGIGVPPPPSLVELYGYINIIQTDTLYYDRNIIYYIKCFRTIDSYRLLMIRGAFFVEKGKIQKLETTLRKERKLIKRRKIPFNRVPWKPKEED
jgi:hypothetical protein